MTLPIIVLYLFQCLLLILIVDSAVLPKKGLPIASKPTFWNDGLKFSCTGCGKCCLNEGEVWINTEEFVQLVDELKIGSKLTLDTYVDEIKNGWVSLKSHTLSAISNGEEVKTDACIFLANDGKTCNIYQSRPLQCRSYPFWPRLLSNQRSWLNEQVSPEPDFIMQDSITPDMKYWHPSDGGCEGIEHVNATIVSPRRIDLTRQLYDSYQAAFPFIPVGNDREKLLERVDIMQRVIKSTKRWVSEFVIGYHLCPFAQEVFQNQRVRYIVSTATERQQVLDKLRYESLYLLMHRDEEIETTLLLLPFFKPTFEDFYEFSLELEDVPYPRMLRQLSPYPSSTTNPTVDEGSIEGKQGDSPSQEIVSNKNRLLSRMAKKSSPSMLDNKPVKPPKKEMDPLQLAFFHPQFAWSDKADDEEINHPLNFEKRSPFPTINLLRSDKIDAYANERKTKKIAKANQSALEEAGSEVLVSQFEAILKAALEDEEEI